MESKVVEMLVQILDGKLNATCLYDRDSAGLVSDVCDNNVMMVLMTVLA